MDKTGMASYLADLKVTVTLRCFSFHLVQIRDSIMGIHKSQDVRSLLRIQIEYRYLYTLRRLVLVVPE